MKKAIKLAYYRIFYCLFYGLKRSYREDDKTISIISSIFLSILMYWNVFSLSLFSTAITGIKIYQYPWHWLLFIFLVLNCLFFLHKQNYLKIKERFDHEEEKIKKRRKTICILYIIFSCLSCPFALFLVGSMGLYGYIP